MKTHRTRSITRDGFFATEVLDKEGNLLAIEFGHNSLQIDARYEVWTYLLSHFPAGKNFKVLIVPADTEVEHG